MGSCISTTKRTQPPPPPPPPPPPHSKHNHLQDRTLVPESDPPPSLPRKSTAVAPKKRPPPPPLPSPPPVEEETVKEVLSETPALPRPNLHRFQNPQKILRLPSFPKLEEHKNSSIEEISELSEICSVGDSVSTSALTEQSRDYEEVLQPRVVDRSPSKIRRKRTDSGECYSRGESPVRRSEQWLVGPAPRQWNVNQNGGGKDQGESSRRRSRSPVTRIDSGLSRPGMCRSPSEKRAVRSAGRSPVASEIGRNLEDARDGKRPVKESLEDPLVSLECFIFL